MKTSEEVHRAMETSKRRYIVHTSGSHLRAAVEDKGTGKEAVRGDAENAVS